MYVNRRTISAGIFSVLVLLSLQGMAGAVMLGAWTSTGSLVTGRWNQTATTLADGRVLVAGGIDTNNHILSSCEIYDPSTGLWSATGSLATGRFIHTATLLPSGLVLVAGGTDGNYDQLTSCEIYNPSTGKWAATGSLKTARAQHTATLLPNGQVLAAGGANGCELYNPSSGAWTQTGALLTGRWNHTATLLSNGTVLVTGGLTFGSSPVTLVSSELYDPSSGGWTSTGSLSAARWGHTATLFSDGKVLVAGGAGVWTNNGANADILSDCEIYNPSNGVWTTTGSLGAARAIHTATLLPGGKVLAAGGQGASDTALSGCELYDESAGAWTATGSLAAGVYGQTASLLTAYGVVLAAGGNSNSGVIPGCETFNPSTPATDGIWQNAANLGGGWHWLNWFGYFNTDNSPWIYHDTLGWLYPYGTSTDSIWFYDPVMNVFLWTSATVYPYVYRAGDGAWLYYDVGSSSPCWFFNFSNNSWESH